MTSSSKITLRKICFSFKFLNSKTLQLEHLQRIVLQNIFFLNLKLYFQILKYEKKSKFVESIKNKQFFFSLFSNFYIF